MRWIGIGAALGAAVAGGFAWWIWTGPQPAMISSFGHYRGYSEQRFDGTRRTSDYLTLRDGTRLAYELIVPTLNGVPASEPLPVLLKYTPYLRTWTIFDAQGHNRIADFIDLDWKARAYLRMRYWFAKDGAQFDPLFRTPWLVPMVKHGYAVVIVERPGTGASFGVMNPAFEANLREIDEVLNWIAARPWSNGKIGMHGDSFQAMVQFPAAATGNSHLKAIFPASAPMELYDAIQYRGGVFNRAFSTFFAGAASHLETLVTPVDTDRNGELLARALKERSHATLRERVDLSNERYAYRDGTTPSGAKPWEAVALHRFIDRINRNGVPVYMTTGWYDIFAADALLWHENLTVPKRLAIRPLDHTGMDKTESDLDYGAEAHRWFDFWLKGIPNGIMDEPNLHYALMGSPSAPGWRTSTQWPVPGLQMTPLYFAAGRTGSVDSSNDGQLVTDRPPPGDGFDRHVLDYSTTTGTRSRWTAVNRPRHYPDMRVNDAKSLTYTTPALENDVEVIGYPIAHLWLSTRAPDLDAFVYLEQVDNAGRSTYITEGTLRASHRSLARAPHKNLGLPFHTHYRQDVAAIPEDEPVELVFNLLPTAFRFAKGTRIRVAVAFADRDNFDTPVLSPPPAVRMLRSAEHGSFIELPQRGAGLPAK